MAGQPTGTVTHLFTDIEGSTGLWEQHPEAMQAALARHDAILQDEIAAHGGHVVKTLGDGFYAVFPTALDAVAAAIAAQEALHGEAWGEVAIKVRMGLHSGAADERDGDYFGPALNRAARLMSAGHGGQILLSRATRELVRDQLSAGVELRDLGRLRLKGLDRAEQVFQVVAPGLPADFAPLDTLESHPNNLPAQATPFVGRETELAELDRLLADPAVRLVTVLGAGGMGKTRLALEAAAAQLDNFEHGVFFVPLAPLQSVEAMVPTMAEALGFSFYEGGNPQQQLLDYLRPKSMLLIMDNFEHLLDGVDLVSDLLEASPELKVLSTSRARLNVQAECLFPLEGMDLPGWELPQDAHDYSAIKLFLQSARRVCPGYELAAADLPHVARICRLVGGMPLGILLAAGWLGMLSPAEIAPEIEAGLDFLETDLRDVPERQRSMRAVFDHSWNLLPAREQAVMRALSVFRGGFDVVAAQQVAGATLRDLRALVDKSLLQRDPAGRYGLHELLQQYAADNLRRAEALRRPEGIVEAQPEQDSIRDAHAAYYAPFLASREEPLRGMDQKQVLAEIRAEIDNIRRAWDWAVTQGRLDELEGSLAPLARFCRIRGWYREGEALFSRAAQRLSGMHEERTRLLQGKLLLQQGRFADLLGNESEGDRLQKASLAIFRELGAKRDAAYALCLLGGCESLYGSSRRELCLEGLDLFQELGDRRGIALALYGLAWSVRHVGEFAEAKQRFRESLALYRQAGDLEGIQAALHGLGYICWILGEYERGRELHLEMLQLCRETGSQGGIARALGDLGIDAFGLQQYDESYELFGQSLAIYRDIGNATGIYDELGDLAEVANAMGDYALAERHAREALRGLSEVGLGFKHGSWEYRNLGNAACGLGNYAEARRYLRRSLETSVAAHQPQRHLLALVGVARVLARQGDGERALELLALVASHRLSWQMAKDQAAPLIDELEAELSPDAVAAAWDRGRARDLEATVQEVLVEWGEGEDVGREDVKRET